LFAEEEGAPVASAEAREADSSDRIEAKLCSAPLAADERLDRMAEVCM